MKRAIIAVLPFLLWGTLLPAAQLYGDAVLEEGAMTIVREGETLKFDTPNSEIPVFEQDLLRLRGKSRAVLKSREQATLTLGSNAVFQVKPWQVKEETGFLRAIYGKFRSVVSELAGGEQFNVKTPTATIGVKGTEYLGHVTNNGDSMLVVTKRKVEMRGQLGESQLVDEGYVSVVINGKPATPQAPVPPQVSTQMSQNNLTSPLPNSKKGGDLAGDDGLVESGIVDQDDLDDSKDEDVDIDVDTGGANAEAPDVDTDLDEAKDNVLRGEANIKY